VNYHPAHLERRLRSFIIADTVLALGGGTFPIVMYLTVFRNDTLVWLGLFVCASSAAIASALWPLRRGDVFGSVLLLSIANWVVAIGVGAVATFTWPLVVQSSLLPAAIGASFVTRRELRVLIGSSLVVAMMVACVGLLQDFTGLADETPDWLRTTVLLMFAPAFGAIVILVLVQHNLALSRSLADELATRRQLTDQADELRRSRQRVVAATDRERRRIERDLHDGAQSRLVAINLQLATARSSVAQDPDAAVDALERIRAEIHRAHLELRELAHGVYPTVLTQHGLVAAIEAAADRSPVPTQLALDRIGRLPAETEATVYFCVLEALQNAAKHAHASRVEIRLRRTDDEVAFTVTDDGVGVDAIAVEGHGMTNMRDRLGALAGWLEVAELSDAGTRVQGTLPLGSGDDRRERPTENP
jgi:signal transduction histidine kinase